MLDNWHFSLAGSLVLESVPGMLCLDMHAALKVVYRRIVQYPIYTDPWLAGSSLT